MATGTGLTDRRPLIAGCTPAEEWAYDRGLAAEEFWGRKEEIVGREVVRAA